MLTLEKVKSHASAHPRIKIQPKVVVQAKPAAQKREVTEVARRAINEHYGVLMALKDR